jgi:2-iminobutanoate/2-iminopropanoate deaminase
MSQNLGKNNVFLIKLNFEMMTFTRFVSALILLLVITACQGESNFPVFHKSHEESRAEALFSDAVETEDFLFLTGQIGKDHRTGKLVEGGIIPETEQTIQNIKDVLDYHGLSLDQVVKCTVILKDINDFSEFNSVYTQHFTKKPARTTFAAASLAGGAAIEIEVVAVK